MRNNLRNKSKSMTSGSYAFLWGVPVDGCKILDDSTHKLAALSAEETQGMDGYGPWLVNVGNIIRQYAPLSKPTLHREFASLNSDESIIGFANSYGLLGQYAVSLFPPPQGPVELGESINRWKYESRDMGILLYVWDLVKGENAGKLSQLVKWLNGVLIAYKYEYDGSGKMWKALPAPASNAIVPGVAFSRIAGNDQHELLKHWQQGDSIEPARYYICREINEHLRGNVAPQIFPFMNNKIYLHPDSLLAAMWVMFSMEILGDIKVRRCDICGYWQELHLQRNNFYCSSACRQEAYRRRRQKEVANHERPHSKER
ncbi:MAG: hypothetical protein NTZ34_06350 [Chloroflexi bacterium]|nr:hypothetical protein [Chloroflexota bacterium]